MSRTTMVRATKYTVDAVDSRLRTDFAISLGYVDLLQAAQDVADLSGEDVEEIALRLGLPREKAPIMLSMSDDEGNWVECAFSPLETCGPMLAGACSIPQGKDSYSQGVYRHFDEQGQCEDKAVLGMVHPYWRNVAVFFKVGDLYYVLVSGFDDDEDTEGTMWEDRLEEMLSFIQREYRIRIRS